MMVSKTKKEVFTLSFGIFMRLEASQHHSLALFSLEVNAWIESEELLSFLRGSDAVIESLNKRGTQR